jgi:hypothetical protein
VADTIINLERLNTYLFLPHSVLKAARRLIEENESEPKAEKEMKKEGWLPKMHTGSWKYRRRNRPRKCEMKRSSLENEIKRYGESAAGKYKSKMSKKWPASWLKS